MGYPVWAAASGKPALAHTGWVLAPGGSVDVVVPDGWNGRLWGRTGCAFDASGRGRCQTGDCAGRLECGGTTGALPATLAEYNLNSYAGLDSYDVCPASPRSDVRVLGTRARGRETP